MNLTDGLNRRASEIGQVSRFSTVEEEEEKGGVAVGRWADDEDNGMGAVSAAAAAAGAAVAFTEPDLPPPPPRPLRFIVGRRGGSPTLNPKCQDCAACPDGLQLDLD